MQKDKGRKRDKWEGEKIRELKKREMYKKTRGKVKIRNIYNEVTNLEKGRKMLK